MYYVVCVFAYILNKGIKITKKCDIVGTVNLIYREGYIYVITLIKICYHTQFLRNSHLKCRRSCACTFLKVQ